LYRLVELARESTPLLLGIKLDTSKETDKFAVFIVSVALTLVTLAFPLAASNVI
jgi:hypothetical protein